MSITKATDSLRDRLYDAQERIAELEKEVEELRYESRKWMDIYYSLWINVRPFEVYLRTKWPEGIFEIHDKWANEVDEEYKP